MKAGIHPNYQPTVIKCACGATIETGSTPAAALISSTGSTALSNLRLQT